jgi:hypothetical protein
MKYEEARHIKEALSPEQFEQAVKDGYEPIDKGLKMFRLKTEAEETERPLYVLGKR